MERVSPTATAIPQAIATAAAVKRLKLKLPLFCPLSFFPPSFSAAAPSSNHGTIGASETGPRCRCRKRFWTVVAWPGPLSSGVLRNFLTGCKMIRSQLIRPSKKKKERERAPRASPLASQVKKAKGKSFEAMEFCCREKLRASIGWARDKVQGPLPPAFQKRAKKEPGKLKTASRFPSHAFPRLHTCAGPVGVASSPKSVPGGRSAQAARGKL